MNVMLGDVATTLPESLRGPLEDFSEKVNGVDGSNWEEAFKTWLSVSKPQPISQASLLIPIGTTTVAATTTLSVARGFVLDTSDGALVKISHLADNFKSWFLRKQEQPFVGSTLRYGNLSRNSVDGAIFKELGGGAENVETTLTELFSLMEAQRNGESGPLLTNGYANIFYIKDVDGDLRTVVVLWRGGGWDVSAFTVTYPLEWYDNVRVFSPDSRLPSAV